MERDTRGEVGDRDSWPLYALTVESLGFATERYRQIHTEILKTTDPIVKSLKPHSNGSKNVEELIYEQHRTTIWVRYRTGPSVVEFRMLQRASFAGNQCVLHREQCGIR